MRHLFIVLTAILTALGVSCGRTEPPSRATSLTASPGIAPPSAAGSAITRSQRAAPVDVRKGQYDQTVYDRPFDGASRLLIKATYTQEGSRCCSTVLHTLLIDRADATRQWEIDTRSEEYEYTYELTRIDPSMAVLCGTDSQGEGAGCFKLFIDPVARRLVKRVDFDPGQAVVFANDTEAQRLLGVSKRDLDVLRHRNFFRPASADARKPPAAFATHPLPQSTYQEFARARPARVRDGYDKDSKLEERVGAWQAEAGGFWFAKTFYDGEGTTGVGAVGFLSRSGQYSFLTIPAVFDWSADVMLVEPDAVWAGLVSHPEGPDRSGGLLRYDRHTQRSEIRRIPGVILRIAHVGSAVFFGTTGGLYVVRDGTTTWHHMEPDVNDRRVVVTETVAQ